MASHRVTTDVLLGKRPESDNECPVTYALSEDPVEQQGIQTADTLAHLTRLPLTFQQRFLDLRPVKAGLR